MKLCLWLFIFIIIKGVTRGPTDGDGHDGVTGTGIPILANAKPGITLNADV